MATGFVFFVAVGFDFFISSFGESVCVPLNRVVVSVAFLLMNAIDGETEQLVYRSDWNKVCVKLGILVVALIQIEECYC